MQNYAPNGGNHPFQITLQGLKRHASSTEFDEQDHKKVKVEDNAASTGPLLLAGPTQPPPAQLQQNAPYLPPLDPPTSPGSSSDSSEAINSPTLSELYDDDGAGNIFLRDPQPQKFHLMCDHSDFALEIVRDEIVKLYANDLRRREGDRSNDQFREPVFVKPETGWKDFPYDQFIDMDTAFSRYDNIMKAVRSCLGKIEDAAQERAFRASFPGCRWGPAMDTFDERFDAWKSTPKKERQVRRLLRGEMGEYEVFELGDRLPAKYRQLLALLSGEAGSGDSPDSPIFIPSTTVSPQESPEY